jgi:hypothetical protein
VLPVCAQNESKFHAEFRGEWDRLTQDCATSGSAAKTLLCRAQALFTDHPLHIAAGSIAPQNGVGFGPAFSYATDLSVWRLNWNADAVASTNGSWRAGLYLNAFPTPKTLTTETQPVISAYAQAISLNQIGFFGLGNSTSVSGKSFFGMREIIPGANVVYPIFQKSKLHIALYGEINGRFVEIRGRSGQSNPSIQELYTDAEAPGLASQPGFLQLGEGLRLRPSFLHNHIKLGYLITFQQFFAPGDSSFTFRRLTLDLSHEFPIYHTSRSSYPNDQVGPDGNPKAGKITFSRNREGSFGARLSISESITPAGNVVPFYFQPTLGGSNINGDQELSSYQDYRFRAPDILLLRGSFEHSVWGPIGFTALTDYGKVGLTRGDIDFDHLRHSFGVGLTLRAENVPALTLLFAWGGREGTHTIGYINPDLLGGVSRPSLF